jgi:O-antigen ligase
MNRESVDRFCERGILFLVLAILVLGPLALGAVGWLSFLVIQGLTIGVLLLWTARLWLDPRPKFLWPPVCWAVLAFAVYTIIRYATAPVEYVARQELIQVLVYAFLFLAIVNNLHRQECVQIISLTVIFLAMTISGYAFYQFLTGSKHVWFFASLYANRGSGTYISPNHLGGFLDMLLPMALAFTFVGRVKAVVRILLGYSALVILVGIAVTVSRGAWFSSAFALLLFFGILVFQRAYRLPALVFFACVLCGGIILAPKAALFEKRLKQMVLESGKLNDDTRYALWHPALRMTGDHPLWGAGPAHFDVLFPAYRPEIVQADPDWVHNDYLNTLADYGIAGGVLVLATMVLLAWGLRRTWSAIRTGNSTLGGKPGSNKFAFLLGSSIGLVAILCHSVVDFNMHIPANAILAVSLMALLASHIRFASDSFWFSAPPATKLLATVALVAGCSYLGYQGARRAGESRWLDRAARSTQYSPEKLDALQKAFAREPQNPLTSYQIGELLQIRSREGSDYYPEFKGVDYRQLSGQAMDWLARSKKLNPFSAQTWLCYGACLDWLGKFDEAEPYFDKADLLDPNGYLTTTFIGLHYVELRDYAAARTYFIRSIRLQWQNNAVARNWLEIANRKLLEAAGNDPQPNLPSP